MPTIVKNYNKEDDEGEYFSKAYDIYNDFKKIVRETSPKFRYDHYFQEKPAYYLSPFKIYYKYNPEYGYDINNGVGEFFLNGPNGQNIQFQLSKNGVLMNATIFKTGDNNQRIFVGKNFDLLKYNTNDVFLVELASKLNWNKVEYTPHPQMEEKNDIDYSLE